MTRRPTIRAIPRIRASLLALVVASFFPSCAAGRSSPLATLASSLAVGQQQQVSTRLHSSGSGNMVSSSTEQTKIRVLALHGSGSTGDSFAALLQSWSLALQERHSTLEMDIVAFDAPHVKDDGYSWWTMPLGVRSSTATDYPGWPESRALVLEQLAQVQPDVVVGHSQGAILLTALLGTESLCSLPHVPAGGFILHGGAWPNPYTTEMEDATVASVASSNGGVDPRLLILHGQRDRINPLEQSVRVQYAFEQKGWSIERVTHPVGHGVPTTGLDAVCDWIYRGVATTPTE